MPPTQGTILLILKFIFINIEKRNGKTTTWLATPLPESLSQPPELLCWSHGQPFYLTWRCGTPSPHLAAEAQPQGISHSAYLQSQGL